jgi:lysozyme
MDARNLRLVLAPVALVAGLTTFEGLSRIDYVDNLPARPVATACYGHTATAKVGTVRTKAQCDELLQWDLNYVYGPAVLKMVNVPITQGQYNALTDFAYNLGIEKLRTSTLLRKVNAQDPTAQAEFMRWVYVGGKDCRIKINNCYGIVGRRQWEATQFAS